MNRAPDRRGEVLEVALEPLEPGTLIATATPRIRHRPGGVSGWPHDPISSDGDYRDTNAWLNGLLDAPVAGARLVDYVRQDGVGMWQFLPSYIWPQVFLAIELVKALDALVEIVGERGVRPLPVADALNGIWTGVVEEYARARGLAFEPGGWLPSGSPARRVARAARLGYLRDRAMDAGAVAGARAIGAAARRREGRGPRTGASVLLASVPRHWIAAPDGSGRHYDEQFTPLLEALRAAGFGRIVGIECPYGPKLDALRSVARRVRGDDTRVTWRSFDSYGGGASARRRAAPLFREQWEALVSGALDSDAARFRGVSILAALRPTVEHAFNVTLPECAALRAGARAILAAERPTAIVATYETGPFQRALTIEGARAGIPTVGLMHGMIFDNHYDYMHEGVGVDPSSAETAFTIPVRTCVWGPLWKRSLTEHGHYPCEAVAVTGNWRYDWLANKAWQRDELRARLGAEAEPVVAILSGGQDRHAFLPACLDAVASVGGLPRIRLHPSEDPAPVRDLLAERGLPAAVLTEGGTLANLVVASDAVLVQFSTAVSEAIMLDRPTIVVDVLRRSWYGAPRDSDAALIALSADEVAVMLRRALEDAPTRDALSVARSQYVEDHFLALDGGAARRVATVVAEATGRSAQAGVPARSPS